MGARLSDIDRYSGMTQLMGARLSGIDRYSGMRLNIDNMTYEQLLELGDRIGHVSKGLKEDAVNRSLKRSRIRKCGNKKCCICQEKYKRGEDTGKLQNCGHLYHTDCIKEWLRQNNMCPICKSEALPKN